MSVTTNLRDTAISLPKKFITFGSVKDDIYALLDDADDVLLTNAGTCSIIVGDSGAGKTMMAKKLVEKYNATYTASETPSLAVYVRSPADMSPLDLYRRILKALGEPGSPKGTKEEMEVRIIAQVQRKNVRMFVFDEFQQVVEKLGQKTVRQQADTLKELMDEHNLFMVFSGTERVVEILKANDQFYSRCTRLIEKYRFSVNTPANYSQLASYLYTLQAKHQIKGVDMSKASIVLPMQLACGGDLREISRLLVKACKSAHSSQRDRLLKNDFITAYIPPKEANTKRTSNPFTRDLNTLKKTMGVTYNVK